MDCSGKEQQGRNKKLYAVYKRKKADKNKSKIKNQKKIKKTNPKLDIKKQKNNVIVVEPLDMDKSELTVYTNKQTYRYIFKVKERHQIENEKLEKYIKKKNPKRIIFTEGQSWMLPDLSVPRKTTNGPI